MAHSNSATSSLARGAEIIILMQWFLLRPAITPNPAIMPAHAPGNEIGQGGRVQPLLDTHHEAVGEAVVRVVCTDDNAALADEGAAIQHIDDKMHAGAMARVGAGKH